MDGTNMQRAQEGMYIYVGNSGYTESDFGRLWVVINLLESCLTATSKYEFPYKGVMHLAIHKHQIRSNQTAN